MSLLNVGKIGVCALLWAAFFWCSGLFAQQIRFKTGEAVHFKGIPQNTFVAKDGELLIKVDKSSSIWLIPFTKIRIAKNIVFAFEIEPKLLEENGSGSKTQKTLDDWPLRVGLLVSGEEPFVPFFAPNWVKAIRATMKLPSDRILNLTPSLKFLGQKWESPYSSSINHVAVQYVSHKGLHEVAFDIPKKDQRLAGIWIQSDGDDLGRTFSVKMRSLELR